jgi:ubiquinol-cytochrome c reductase cytochrome c1 subunit
MRRPVFAAEVVAPFALVAGLAGSGRAEEAVPAPPHQTWSFDGVFGTYDRAALQRGFQVYKDVCASCHAVRHLYFRDLVDLGYTEDQVKGIAAQYQVNDGPNEQGQMFERPGRPADRIPGPFPNDEAARAANNGALPPDLSLITKARAGGPDYVAAVLTGYKDPPPAGFKVMEGMYYNEYFPGHQIKMPPPLSPDQTKYADNTPATVPQMAHDVVNFLAWAAEPTLEARHRMGFKVILFLVIAAGVFYAAKRKIWSRIQH